MHSVAVHTQYDTRHTSSNAGSARAGSTSLASPQSQSLFVEKHGKLHHAFPKALAPYPVNYEPRVLDADALDLAFQLQLLEGNPTTIPEIRLDDVKTHPRKVLDIGCGSGDWILAAARAWPEATFVGLDLVIGHQIPLHLLDKTYSPSHDHESRQRQQRAQQQPQQTVNLGVASMPNGTPLDQSTTVSPPALASQSRAAKLSASTLVGSTLGSRIEWVQANFLKSLPFLDEEFDFIHASGISRGVPEDKWDCLFSEISRILAADGCFEMFEEDIIFPVLPRDPELPSSSSTSLGHPEPSSIQPAPEPKAEPRYSFSSHSSAVGDENSLRRRSMPSSGHPHRHVPTASVPQVPPVPPLRINTNLTYSQQDRDTAHGTPITEFPFVSPSKLYSGGGSISGGGGGPAASASRSSPKKKSSDPAIPPGWEGPVSPINPSNIPSPSQPFSKAASSGLKKQADRLKNAAALTSSIVSSKTSSILPYPSRIKRPSSAGSGLSGGGVGGARTKLTGHLTDMSSSNPVPDTDSVRRPSLSISNNGKPNIDYGAGLSSSSTLSVQTACGGNYYHNPSFSSSDVLSISPSSIIRHDHELLQTLFYGVYERRFINTSPTAILPSFFNVYFQGVIHSPPIDFPNPPTPPAFHERCRREKRNLMQREWGRGGLEFSQDLAMNSLSLRELASPSGIKDLSSRLRQLSIFADKGPVLSGQRSKRSLKSADGKVDGESFLDIGKPTRSLKKTRSTPGLSISRPVYGQHRRPSKDSESSFSTYYSGSSDSPTSTKTSILGTPVTKDPIDPAIQTPSETVFRDPFKSERLGRDQGLVESFPQRAPEEEEDAKFAIMGDGGCFSASKPNLVAPDDDHLVRVVSKQSSLASMRRRPSPELVDKKKSFWIQDDEDDMYLGLLISDGLDDDEDQVCDEDATEMAAFDHVGARELGVIDGVFEPLRQKIYVRPRVPFTGQNFPIPQEILMLDDLSMGIHLTRAWMNVVACKEAMWEELQRRGRLVYVSSDDGRSPGLTKRITPLDDIEWVGSEVRMSDRDKFELLFLRFEDDMRHWAGVGATLPAKLSWIDPRFPNHGPVPPIPPTATKYRSEQRSSLSGSSTTIYTHDDGRGPGRNGIIIPGVDTCRTMRAFAGRKAAPMRAPGGNAMKVINML